MVDSSIPDSYSGKRITVFGANRSGIAIAKLLYDLEAKVCITDTQDRRTLSDTIAELIGLPIEFYLNGHPEACIENAELIVVSPGVPLDIPILVEAKKRNITIIGELELSASLCQAPIVAITGTKGKSTTTLLTASILSVSKLFQNVVVTGNIGVPLASKVSTLTDKDVTVVETSSFQLETTLTFQPDVSVILNFSPDHLDRHKTMEAYFNAKRKICANQTDSDWIVLNATDSNVISIRNNTKARRVFFTDTVQDTNEGIKTIFRELDSTLGVGLRSYTDGIGICNYIDNQENLICNITELPLVGSHNVRNILAAIAVGTIFGVPPGDLRKGVLEFDQTDPALQHAFEKVNVINGVEYINDSKATNVIATYAAIESIEKIGMDVKGSKKRVFLIIGGYDKGNNYEPLEGLVKRNVKCLVLLGEHTQHIEKALGGSVETYHTVTMEQAVDYAFNHASQGDIVLLSPANASFDMYSDYKERGEAFKSAVNKLNTQEDNKDILY